MIINHYLFIMIYTIYNTEWNQYQNLSSDFMYLIFSSTILLFLSNFYED